MTGNEATTILQNSNIKDILEIQEASPKFADGVVVGDSELAIAFRTLFIISHDLYERKHGKGR